MLGIPADELRNLGPLRRELFSIRISAVTEEPEPVPPQQFNLFPLVKIGLLGGPERAAHEMEWTRAIGINLMGTVLMCRAVLPQFREREHGKIVNLSGGGATEPLPRFSAYSASKAAVVRFTARNTPGARLA